MDNDDMYEKFEITDYDLDNEFNPTRGKRATKEQQIYGKSSCPVDCSVKILFHLFFFCFKN